MAAACPRFAVIEKTVILPESQPNNGHDANYRLTFMVPKRRYLSFLRERWWVTLLCVTLAVGTVLTYETLRTEDFISSAQLYLTGNAQVNNVVSLFNEESLTYFGTQIELLKGPRLQAAALDKAGIIVEPGKKPSIAFEVVQPLKTSILKLQATGPDPAKTQTYLQALIDEYRAFKKETREATSEDIVISLTDQLAKRETSLRDEQQGWAAFQKSNNVAVLEEEARSSGTYLNELTLQLAKLKLEHELLTNGLAPAAALGGAGIPGLEGTPGNASISSLVECQALLNKARMDLAMMRAGKDRPVEGLKRQYDDGVAREENAVGILEKECASETQTLIRQLETRIAAINEAISFQEAKLLNVNERLSENQRLKDNVARQQGYYDHLLGTLQNVDLSKTVQQERLSILQPATPAQPEKRYLALRLALSFVCGLLLSMGLVFAWHLLDDRFVSVRDIKDQFGETLLGLVPQIRVSRRKPQQALLEVSDSRLAYLESYRHLRSALLLSSFDQRRHQTLLFTSATSAEGKTTIAVNLARLLARSGLRVVLVDADAHGGGMHRLLGNKDQAGVLDYLRGDSEAEGVLHPSDLQGLSFVPAGTHNKHSEGLFLSSKLADLLKALRQNQDFVILDAPPILTSDDAAMLVPHADAVVLVTRPFYSRSRLVRRALDMLYQRQAKQVNIILNRARPDDVDGHYAANGRFRKQQSAASHA
jgi:capsular exopolysaccharide synthesis family protein